MVFLNFNQSKKGLTMKNSNTRVTVENGGEGLWLATIDMDLGKGQRFTFSSLVPIAAEQTVVGIQHELLKQAHGLLATMTGQKEA
ncbi:hypothetical protein A7P23_27675 [Achromobacter xylosoxidans]|nr:hypothetical protein A7P23_27675 [Achromobacter xylosoxidans]